ncbi:YcnI family protein [Brevundimonas sp.]|uniref:YcnI family protein n=1 Tax=Brevundimonas sp. TaxID=1871086 RepID=UPI002D553C6F|nr:YcnI family protein [Brevundimonas sp.]HYC67313.1 YcnI family protein [Brevundimonas sp.]
MNKPVLLIAALAAATLAGAAQAHVVFTQPNATAGGHWAGALRVSHGCDGSATTAVRVEIPEGIVVARPQVPAGWNVAIERQPLAQPVPAEGGGVLTERVSAITWTGRLPEDQFEEFGLAAKLPAEAGALAFPVIQTCEQGEARWTEAVVAGAARPAHPAPVLTLQAGGSHH